MGQLVENGGKPTTAEGLVIEAWAEGYSEFSKEHRPEFSAASRESYANSCILVVGSLIIMACITVSNMRKGVLLHKLIFIELLFGTFMGTVIFIKQPVYHWYLSVTAIFLNTSWSLHNVIAWIKNKPFLSRRASLFYIWTVALAQPYWVVEIVANWLYYDNYSNIFVHTRPFEALFRDPWWIFTICSLFWNIKRRYEFGYIELIRISPRFGVLLGAMLLSICFIILDILSVTHVIHGSGLPEGINPFWKLAFVFKCLTDTIVLDDFKTALDRLKRHRLEKIGGNISGLTDSFADVDHVESKWDPPLPMPRAMKPARHVERAATSSGVAHESEQLDFITALNMDSSSSESSKDMEKG